MALNLAKGQFANDVEVAWTNESYLMGKVSNKYENLLDSVKSITIMSPLTVPLVDYTRSGDARFGTMTEVEDDIQTLEMTQDKSFTKSMDRGNLSDQKYLKSVGAFIRQQMSERVIPEQDKWALKKFSFQAGTSKVHAAVSASNILGFVLEARAVLTNAFVPEDNRYLYIGTTNSNFIRTSNVFNVIDSLANPNVLKGVIGGLYGFNIVEVPDTWLPTGVQFLVMHKDSGLMPKKIKTLRGLDNQKGVDGYVIEGRFYYDAFVLAKKVGGIFASVLTANKIAIPVITPTGASHAVTADTGVVFFYTLDGSDPRYSATAIQYSGAVTLTSGQTIRVVGKRSADDKCWSDVASATY